MSAFSSRGTRIYMTLGSATPTVLVPTAISKAKPAVVTVASTGLQAGDVVMCKNTGFSELDGKAFVVGAPTGANFTLVGSDTTSSTGTLGANPQIEHYDATDMISVCLSSFSINNTEPGTVSVATFCDPSASLPSATQEAGTVNVAGYVNDTDADYREMMEACIDGRQRILQITLPGGHGSLLAPVTFGAMGYDVPIDGAPAWSATGVLGSAFRHVF